MLAPSALATPSTATDARDAGAADVESVSHSDTDGVVKYTVKTFAPVHSDQVGELRWELDMDGDDALRGTDDACAVLKPVRGTSQLRAGLYKGCEGSALVSADARVNGRVIKLRLLVSELERAGLDDDAPGYSYRFTSVDRNGTSDSVPDSPGGLITHVLSGRDADGNTTSQIRAAESATPSPSPKASGTPTPRPPSKGGRDTTSTGKADASTVEPGEDVDIEGSGFARRAGLRIFLAGSATSTATASPTPTASASPKPSSSPTASPSASPTTSPSPAPFRRAEAQTADVVTGQRVVSGPTVMAAAVTPVQLGVAIADEDGNIEDDVEIPEDTANGTYRIVVEGPNPRRGTNTVTIPIVVAAETDGSGQVAGPGTNATGTATQASPSPVAGTTTTGGGGAALPKTGSQSLQTIFGLGVLALVIGGSLLGARRIAGREPAVAASGGTGPVYTAMVPKPVRAAFTVPNELRGEMQRLLARRTDRDDPDRDADL